MTSSHVSAEERAALLSFAGPEAVDDLGPVQGARPAPKPATPRAPDLLDAGAATFRERNAIYGDNYLAFGKMMAGMFPRGLALQTEEDWNRMGAFMWCCAKVQRYAATIETGGHVDSAHDLMVYAAILEEITRAGGKA